MSTNANASVRAGHALAANDREAPAVRRALGRRPSRFRILFALVIACYVVLLILLIGWGQSYYRMPLQERLGHPLYRVLRPPGTVGHSLGVAGTVMMLSIYLYSLRKRLKPLQRIGNQTQWLQVHVFLGVAGPILVTFHTTGKLGGIVSIAFYSMWAMVASGVIGRYLYAKIPRTVQGSRMSLKEIEERLAELVEELRHSERRQVVLERLEGFLARTRRQRGGFWRAIVRAVRDDLRLPVNAFQIWRIVGTDRSVTPAQRLRIARLVLKQKRVLNHLAVLDAMQSLFSYWHVFHKPFTVITFAIVFLHVAVALYLGYGLRW